MSCRLFPFVYYVPRLVREQPLQEAQCRMVKRLCLASLAMAGWLLGMTVIGFLIAVKGPIGAAAVAFYSEEFDLDCGNSVNNQSRLKKHIFRSRWTHPKFLSRRPACKLKQSTAVTKIFSQRNRWTHTKLFRERA